MAQELSLITPLSELDLFTPPLIQNSIIRDVMTEHRPISSIDSKSPIEFIINSSENLYPRLDKTRLRIRARINIEKPLSSSLSKTDWESVSLNHNAGGFIFKMVDFTIGDRVVTPPHQTYGYTVDIETKLGKARDIKETSLANQLWLEKYPDDPDSQIIEYRPIITFAEEANLSKGREFEFLLPVHLSMFQQPKALIGGCNLRLRFFPNDPAVFIKLANTVRLKSFEITDACLFMHHSQVVQPVIDAQRAVIEQYPARYPIREAFTIPITIPAGTQDHIIDQLHNGQIPNRAFVMLVDHSAFIGSHVLSANNYQNFGLNFAAFYINGIQYPEIAFTPNFKTDMYAREYNSLFEVTNQDYADTCITITKKNFAKGNTILGVNFTPDLSTGSSGAGYSNPTRFGSVRLHLKFDTPLAKTITALVYFDYDTVLEINHERNPIINLV